MNPVTGVAWVAAAFLSASLFSHTVALRLLLLLVGALLAAIAVSRNRRDIQGLPPIWIPFALWVAWAVLSLGWSLEPARTLKELRNELGYAALALWICFVGAQARDAARIFLTVLAAATTAVIVIGLWEFSNGWDSYVAGLHGGPGNHSSALLTLMPCVAMTGWYGWRAKWPWPVQLVVWGVGSLLPVSAYFTLSRTIWLGFGVQLALLGGLVLLRRKTWSPRSRILAGTFTFAILAVTATALLTIQVEREAIGAKSFEQDPRLALWPEIVKWVEKRPFTGYGFGRGLLREELSGVDPLLWHAHSIFLEALLQLGVPGLTLLLILLGALARQAWRLARDSDDAIAACGMALIGVVAGMLVRNMTDALLIRQNALLFWGVVGALLALGARSRTNA